MTGQRGGARARTIRVGAGLISLGTVIIAARTVADLAPWAALLLGLLFGLLTYTALGLTPRAGFLRRLRGRRLQLYFGVMGLAMGSLGLLLPLLPGMEAERTISIVLVVCAAVYVCAAMTGFGRRRRPDL